MMLAPLRWLTVLVGLCVLPGCGTGIGPRSIGNERIIYNEVLRKTQDEQLLLNLVRLRYNDTTQFLDLGSVVAQYGVETRSNMGVQGGINGFFGGAAPDVGRGAAGVEVSYQERPTVTYAPLQGEKFANRMLTPIPLEVIVLLTNSGWSIERLSMICIERVNQLENAASASGPTPESAPDYTKFHEYTLVLRTLVKHQLIRIHGEPLPGEDDNRTPAFGESGRIGEGKRIVYLIVLPTQDPVLEEQCKKFISLLGLPEGTRKIRLTKSFYPMSAETMAIRSRSLMGVLYFCSQAVEVPQEHEASHLARVTRTPDGDSFDWGKVHRGLLKIKSSKKEPPGDMLKVNYRGYWFYIDDSDPDSKATFSLLQLLFSLQSTAGQERTPLLTIPTN